MAHHHPEQPKKHFPFFWNTMKHPSLTSSPLPLPNQSLDSLTVLQRSTYDFIVNTLSEPNFQLPITSAKPAPAPTSSSTAKENVLQDPPSSNKLTQAEKCFCSREAILRVCRATKWDRIRALKRLIDTLVWRREFKVDEINSQELSHEAETGKQFTLGYDNHQRPILYMFPYRQNTQPSINQIKLLVWYLERTIDLMPPGVETLTLIIDFGDSSKTRNGQMTPISIAKEVLKILQTYYCERLAQAICINVPWVFWGFLKLLKPFLDPKTAEKVLFDPVVTDHVPAEQLIKESFNGTLDFQYDHEVYYKLFAELTASRKKKMLARYDRYGGGRIGMSEFVLRGGNRRRSQTTRELSVGSYSGTAVSSSTFDSAPVQPTLRNDHGPSRQPTTEAKSSSKPSDSPSATQTIITSKDCGLSPRPEGCRHLQLTGAAGETISSRPLSPNSFSPSFTPSPVHQKESSHSTSREEERGSTHLFSRLQSKSKRKSAAAKRESSQHILSGSSDLASSPEFWPTKSSSNPHRHTFSGHPHHFQSLLVSPDDPLPPLPDHLSYSRRITKICS